MSQNTAQLLAALAENDLVAACRRAKCGLHSVRTSTSDQHLHVAARRRRAKPLEMIVAQQIDGAASWLNGNFTYGTNPPLPRTLQRRQRIISS